MWFSVVFTLKYFFGGIIFVSSGSKERRNVALNMVNFLYFLIIWKYWIIPVISKGALDHINNMILCRRVFINTNYFPPYLMDVYNLIEYRFFSWIFVLTMFFSMRYVMTWTLLHFPASFWLNRASKTFWTVVGYFLPMPRMHKLVLFIARK